VNCPNDPTPSRTHRMVLPQTRSFKMSVHPPTFIASVNMRRRNAVTHALLNSDTHTNIYLIQEPWFDTIGTARLDTAQQGVDILGGVASPGWEILYPVIPKG
jgi:hypothetical protein